MNDFDARVTGFASDGKKTTFFTKSGSYTLRSISYGHGRKFMRMPLLVGVGLLFCGIALASGAADGIRSGLAAYGVILMFVFFAAIGSGDEEAGFPGSELLYCISLGYFAFTPPAAMHLSVELVLAIGCGALAIAITVSDWVTRAVWEPFVAAVFGAFVATSNLLHPLAGNTAALGLLGGGFACLILAFKLFISSGSYEAALGRIVDD